MAIYYVSITGNDSNAGTAIGAPWRTIQKAANTAVAGSTVNIRAGIYAETIEVNVSGSAGAGFITFQSYPGETAIIDGSSFSPYTSGSEHDVILMDSRSYVRWQGLEIRNFNTATQNVEINGILVMGTSHHIEIIGNKIHDIRINVTQSSGGNGHGILVIGTNATTAMTDIVIDTNEVYNLRTGFSECITVNGNVTNWRVTNNVVHDCNNIAIDAAGHYGVCPNAANDQARNGIISGNRVTDIDSSHNPAYGGNFTTGGGGHSADGLYVDGGTNIVIERNTVIRANIGIEMASEHAGKSTSFITVRDNWVIESSTFGITIGGYDTDRGSTENCKILNNTLLNNGTLGESDIEMQFDTRNNVIKNNVIYGNGLGYFIHNGYTQNTGNVVDYNMFFGPGGASAALFAWKNVGYTGFTAYKAGSGNDAHSIYADPLFVNKAIYDLHLQAASPAIGAGDSSVIGSGELDIDGEARIQGSVVDMGADEYAAGGGPPPHTNPSPVSVIEAVALSESVVGIKTSVGHSTPGAVSISQTVSLIEGIVALHTGSQLPGPVIPPTSPPLAPRTQEIHSPFPVEAFVGPRITHYHQLGAGVVRPFVRASHGDLGNTQGVDTVLSNVGQIFGTKKKTFPWRPEFGSSLEGLRHRANNPALRELAGVYAREGLSRWEPRCKLQSLDVDVPLRRDEQNQVTMHARLLIEGAQGPQTFSLKIAGTEGIPAVEDPQGYSVVDTTVRTVHGLGQFAIVPSQQPVLNSHKLLGTGLIRPLTRGSDWSRGVGAEVVLSNVGEVLGTIPGTMPWLPEFGCKVHQLRHRSNTPATKELARLYVEQAMTKWEPRAKVTKVELLDGESRQQVIAIRIVCRLDLLQEGGTHLFDIALKEISHQ
jgi:phage baseplate assembly protein W